MWSPKSLLCSVYLQFIDCATIHRHIWCIWSIAFELASVNIVIIYSKNKEHNSLIIKYFIKYPTTERFIRILFFI